MKKVILSVATLVVITFTACNKTKTITPTTASESKTELADNIGFRQVGGGSRGEPNLTGKPTDPGCGPGNAACQEVIVSGFAGDFYVFVELMRVASTTGNFDGNTINKDFLKSLQVSNPVMFALYSEVIAGTKTMVEAPMPNAQGEKAAFLIGHTGNMPTSHSEGALIFSKN